MMTIDDISPAPWDRYGWTGELVSADGCPTTDFTRDDVERVIWWATTEETDWDGNTAGVVLLKDGRYAAWEADWGPTGNGFCCDAYGGTADIVFAHTQAAAEAHLSDDAKSLTRRTPQPSDGDDRP